MPGIPAEPSFNWMAGVFVVGALALCLGILRFTTEWRRESALNGGRHPCMPAKLAIQISQIHRWLSPNEDGVQPWRTNHEVVSRLDKIDSKIACNGLVAQTQKDLMQDMLDVQKKLLEGQNAA